VGNRILLLSPHPGRVRAEINSHQFGLHSMGGSEFQSTAKRIHGLLFDEPAQARGADAVDAADAGNNLPRPPRAQEA
jgi:NitT/TauT family transport system ATP-binding protein